MRLILLAALFFALPAALAPTALAADPVLTLEPDSGPCDGTVTARGENLPTNTPLKLALALPQSDQEAGDLAEVTTDSAGSFTATFSFGQLGCDTLARARELGPWDHHTVYVDDPGPQEDLEIYTRADYQIEERPVLPSTGVAQPSGGRPALFVPVLLAVSGAAFAATSVALRRITR